MGLKNILPSTDISATGLSAMRRRMNAIASNIANVETTRTDEGGPYRRRQVLMNEGQEQASFNNLINSRMGSLYRSHGAHFEGLQFRHPNEKDRFGGVDAEMNVSDDEPLLMYKPDHPDADEEGYVLMPNINLMQEMVDLIVASRAYEANLTVVEADKAMVKEALKI